MKKSIIFGFFLILSLAIVFFSCEKESEREISEKEVPQVIRDNFAQKFPEAKVKEYSEEIENGKKFYEISCVWEGTKMDITFEENGVIAVTETRIEKAQLPEAVQAQLDQNYSEYQIGTIEKVEESGKTNYEIKVSQADKWQELLFSETGELVKKEAKKAKED